MLFDELCERLAIQGYTEAYQVEPEQLLPIARTWLLETAPFDGKSHPRTRLATLCWTGSVCTQIMNSPEFNQAVTERLARAGKIDPTALAAKLIGRMAERKKRQQQRAALPNNVVPLRQPTTRIVQMPSGGGSAA